MCLEIKRFYSKIAVNLVPHPHAKSTPSALPFDQMSFVSLSTEDLVRISRPGQVERNSSRKELKILFYKPQWEISRAFNLSFHTDFKTTEESLIDYDARAPAGFDA